mmetsp:Transcript_70674/g.132269  ORF Transcript_70674/g.132269 Transcript_70674/m.132269 type:complete len:164 (-) Transcript_70674:37-528(-)
MTTAVDFELHAAVKGNSLGFDCIDEDDGCPMTRYVLCAFGKENATTKLQQLHFLTCWDRTTGTAKSRADSCAEESKIDPAAIACCYEGGDGDKLLQSAADAFTKKFPGMYSVPRVEINGKVHRFFNDYSHLLKALCDTGIEIPACGKTPQVAGVGESPAWLVV